METLNLNLTARDDAWFIEQTMTDSNGVEWQAVVARYATPESAMQAIKSMWFAADAQPSVDLSNAYDKIIEARYEAIVEDLMVRAADFRDRSPQS